MVTGTLFENISGDLVLSTIAILTRLALAMVLTVFAMVCVGVANRKQLQVKEIFSNTVLLSMIVCLVLMAINNSLTIAIGLFGALSIIRFRMPVKNTNNMLDLFLAIAIGIACGTGAFKIAIVSTFFISAVLLIAGQKIFKSKIHQFILKIVSEGSEKNSELEGVLKKYAHKYILLEAGHPTQGIFESVFEVETGDATTALALVEDVRKVAGTKKVWMIRPTALEG